MNNSGLKNVLQVAILVSIYQGLPVKPNQKKTLLYSLFFFSLNSRAFM